MLLLLLLLLMMTLLSSPVENVVAQEMNSTVVDHIFGQLIVDAICPRRLVEVGDFVLRGDFDDGGVVEVELVLQGEGQNCDNTLRRCRLNTTSTLSEVMLVQGDCKVINSSILDYDVAGSSDHPVEVPVVKSVVYEAFDLLLQDRMCPRKIVRVDQFRQETIGAAAGARYLFDLVLSANDMHTGADKGCCCCGDTEIVAVKVDN